MSVRSLKVDWKYFAPQNQWRAHLQNSQQQSQQAEATQSEQTQVNPSQSQSPLLQVGEDYHRAYSQPEIQPETQQISNQIQYGRYVQPQQFEEQNPDQFQYKVYPAPQAEQQPQQNQQNQDTRFTDATTHAKRILESYKTQGTYSEPRAELYQSDFVTAQQYDQQPRNHGYQQSSSGYEQSEQSKSRRDYTNRRSQGRIVYKDDYEQQQQQLRNDYEQQQQQQQQQNEYEQQQQQGTQVEHIPVPIERLPAPSPQKLILDQSMPKEIQQLLHYQARLPYDVIANSISYKPKTLFVPKQISAEAEVKEPYQYRSKIYYVNHGRYEDDFEITKPVEENQRH
ncbi:adenylate cyclase, terminal-differentiation specific-like [Ceratina calcarata]|uniref:Adenylate cyclase, terminal-differentiation specific-like n=1 Tax=Ceratina calcarata TaxID=156304 RepID=A0AAJ7J025_9HYME|nr:adenylate cyclase, terminal-differentiation specific-like [Ceratina calcarata]